MMGRAKNARSPRKKSTESEFMYRARCTQDTDIAIKRLEIVHARTVQRMEDTLKRELAESRAREQIKGE